MRVAEIEEHAIKRGLNPKHAILGKGGRVIWFVCVQQKEEKERIVIYDSEGKTYRTAWMNVFEEDFFDEVKVSWVNDLIIDVNNIRASASQSLDLEDLKSK